MKARTRTWSDVVKGLKQDELETSNMVESGIRSDIAYAINSIDTDETYHVKAKMTRMQPKLTSI